MNMNNLLAAAAIVALQSRKTEIAAREAKEALGFVRPAMAETMLRDFNLHREAIRAHDSFAAEATWEKCERWIAQLDVKTG